jgi:oxaloacetate decarboxylase beta subunit
MALVLMIQAPILRALTNPEERQITVTQLCVVYKREKIVFPVVVLWLVACFIFERLTISFRGSWSLEYY